MALELELPTVSSELLYGCWESNLDPLEEEPVLLTAEPSVQPRVWFLSFDHLVQFLPMMIYTPFTKQGVSVAPQTPKEGGKIGQ